MNENPLKASNPIPLRKSILLHPSDAPPAPYLVFHVPSVGDRIFGGLDEHGPVAVVVDEELRDALIEIGGAVAHAITARLRS